MKAKRTSVRALAVAAAAMTAVMIMTVGAGVAAGITAGMPARMPRARTLAPAAQSDSQAVTPGKMVRFGDAAGYLALPAGTGRHPAVIVIQEWWGLNAWVREQADRLAAAGYVALAPDLYHGRSADTPQAALALVRSYDQARGMADLAAADAYLNQRRDVRRGDIGVIGWCFGGGQAADFAARAENLRAVVIYYGDIPGDAAEVAKIRAPVLGNFGGADRGIPPARVERFAAQLRAAGAHPDIKIYPGMPHAFAGSRATAPAERAAAADAWRRSLAFLREHLRPRGGRQSRA